MYILFSIGHDRYALDTSHVVEVVPRVELWQIPKGLLRTSPGCFAIGDSSCRCSICASSCKVSRVLSV